MTTEGGLRQCLTDLTRADTSGDYQKALQAANRIIRRYPREHYAFKCKLVCLIHLSMYDDALTLLKKTPPSQMGECAFEKAYILYRLDKNVEALEILETCGRSDHRALELRAQLYYRLDKFQEALEIFRDLLRNHSDSYDEERKANYIAVLAQLEALGLKQQTSTDNESFEQLYNAACHLIEAGNHELALSSLNKAIDLCRETLSEEGLDEEEIEDELAVLRVQRAYVLHKLGRKKEAIDIYKDLQAAGPSDVGVMATLANNMAGAIEDQGIADSRRKLKSALQLDKSKLSTRQRRILMLNNALVLLHSNQREPCRRALDDLVKIFGSSRETRLLEAALYFRLNEFEKAIKVSSRNKLINEVFAWRRGNFCIVHADSTQYGFHLLNLENGDIQMEMTRIHLMVNSGNFEGAVDALKNLPIKLRLKPALVSLAVSLLVSIDRKDDALELINEAIEHMSDLKIREQMLDQAATLESSKGNMAAAAVYLEKLHEVNPTDIRVICRLIRAYTDCNPQKAEQLSTQASL
ncbi:tetratricopeptide repeat protein [Dictyocaulus viviparus]|uniref:Signal recognition particle subunit SRP72 n=1 Tax=Dictyocaulus viviparus TaxID=29172 RepID=A0A0D8XEE9_DICVI|nr:tetratricopeptide repeat protein [Dictyocaulus viviparus]